MTLEVPRGDSAPRVRDTVSGAAEPIPASKANPTAPGLFAFVEGQESAPVSAAPTVQTRPAAESPEVKAAREAVRLAEDRLIAAKNVTGTPDAEFKRLSFELASSRLALAEARHEPDDRIEFLNGKMVVAKVLLKSATAKDKNEVVAYIRGTHLFVNNIEVDYIRKLAPGDRDQLIKQCGGHVQIMNIKPGDVAYRSSPPGMYFEFYKNYPAQRIQPDDLARIKRDGPQVIPANAENLEKLRHIKSEVDATIKYQSDQAHWGKPQQWNEGEDGFGDCEDFAAKAQRLCLEAGFPHEALLLTFVIDHTNVWHIILTVRTSDGDYCIDQQMERPRDSSTTKGSRLRFYLESSARRERRFEGSR